MMLYCIIAVVMTILFAFHLGLGAKDCGHRNEHADSKELPWIVRAVHYHNIKFFGALIEYDDNYMVITDGQKLKNYVEEVRKEENWMRPRYHLLFAEQNPWWMEDQLSNIVVKTDIGNNIVLKTDIGAIVVNPCHQNYNNLTQAQHTRPLCLPTESPDTIPANGFTVSKTAALVYGDNRNTFKEFPATVVSGRCSRWIDPKLQFCVNITNTGEAFYSYGAPYYSITSNGYIIWGVNTAVLEGYHIFRRVSATTIGPLLAKKRSRWNCFSP